MLRLDELIEEHAYDDPTQGGIDVVSAQAPSTDSSAPAPPPFDMVPILTNYKPESDFLTEPAASVTSTKPIPPPAPLPRRFDPNMFNQKVVYPPKEACFNLPIMFPSIPESGTKSRVETQIRVTMDLADGTATSETRRYDRVGTWKWLRLPAGTATKKPTRKQGKVDAEPEETLYLAANVSCASPPHSQVISCSSCRTREAKRVAKKIAARVKPQKSDSESMEDGRSSRTHEDTTSILQFNCADTIEFSNGSVVLPIRITCYCRHHREKVGFRLNFSLVDHVGRLVGIGASAPIMITDDHKTAGANSNRHGDGASGYPVMDSDWGQAGSDQASRRKKRAADSSVKKKPYDSAAKPDRQTRHTSVSNAPSPASSTSSAPCTRSPSPPSSQSFLASEPPSHSQVPSLHNSSHESESSPDGPSTPLDYSPDVNMLSAVLQEDLSSMLTPTTNAPQSQVMIPPHQVNTYPFMYFGQAPPAPPSMQIPTIHRLIPNTGPTHGGIEVTVLGANFHPNVTLNCVFGDVVASSTQRWSENTLVCVLPPRATPGVVAVWVDGFAKLDDPNTPPCLFTYSDETDRALMELALQVVGLKMTGKIEDAKNVAMRIVGNAGDGSDQSTGNAPNSMQLATRELRPFLLQQVGENGDFEKVITNFLSVMDTPVEHAPATKVSIADALAYTTASGQTLLHLSSFLKFVGLTQFLLEHGADVDARDRNGYTSLHVAALVDSKDVAACLLGAGADTEIVNALGKTAEEVAVEGFFDDIVRTDSPETVRCASEEEEAHWGDAEEESEDEVLRRRRRQTKRRQSGHSTPAKMRSMTKLSDERPPSRAGKQEKLPEKLTPGVHDKQAASLVDMIHKTFFPQLPLPQLPNFPQLPGVLQNIPVFPVYVPMMPNWAHLGRAAERDGDGDGEDRHGEVVGVGANAMKAAHDFRNQCDKWLAQVLQLQQEQRQQQAEEDIAPPAYTPRRVVENGPEQAEGSRMRRRAEYDIHKVTRQEVNSYGYEPSARQQQKLQKKHDRMLVLFWLPILFMSILWGMFNGMQFAFQMVKAALPLPPLLRQ